MMIKECLHKLNATHILIPLVPQISKRKA